MNKISYKLQSFGISDVGLRKNNEDVWASLPEKRFFILADGMGGHKAGEIASSLATQSMCTFMTSLGDQPTVEQACLLLREAMTRTNDRVYKESHQNPEYSGMGTTLSCFIVIGEYLVYAHIGDSRLYRFRGKLERLTEDHSLRNALCLKEEPAASLRNVITRAIGTHPTILPDIGVIPLRPRDIYMLCSDGLSDYVDEKKMALFLSSSLSLEGIGQKLVQAALKRGGNDNITLLLIQLS